MLGAIERASRRPTPILIQAATGAGKSLVMITEAIRSPGVTAILSGRDKLVAQTAATARTLATDVGVWSAGQKEKTLARINVVSIHSAGDLVIPDLSTVIVDECHGLVEGRYTDFLARHPGVRVIGFTATPWRAGKPIYGDGCFFPSVTYHIGMRRLIDEGFLVPPVAKAMPNAWDTRSLEVRGGDFVPAEMNRMVKDGSKIDAQVRDAIPRLIGRNRVVWTCVSIEHAEDVDNRLAMAGESVAAIHSRSPNPAYALECFENGTIRHAVSVMMLSEGIDIPAVDAVVLMRPTRSPTLMVQTIGRGLRPFPGKENCAVLDYGQIIENCGPVDDPYIRDPKSRRSSEKFTPTIRVCSDCLTYVPYDVAVCPECGHEEKRVIDRMKELARRAAEVAMLAAQAPQEYDVTDARAEQYISSKGNNCILITIGVRGRIQPVKMYGSEHPYSWSKLRPMLSKLTPFQFNSWKECYNAVPEFGRSLEVPLRVIVKQKDGFDVVLGIYN